MLPGAILLVFIRWRGVPLPGSMSRLWLPIALAVVALGLIFGVLFLAE